MMPVREYLSSRTDNFDIMASGNRNFWDFPDRSLPSSTVIGLLLGLAIAFTLTLVVSLYILNFAECATCIVKVVGMTVTEVSDSQLQLTLISGRDVDDLTLLEVYLNGIQATPVRLPYIYHIGTTICYTIPPEIQGGGYSISVVGSFSDGYSLELFTTVTPVINRVSIHIPDILSL